MSDLEQSDIEQGDLEVESDNEDVGIVSKISIKNLPLVPKITAKAVNKDIEYEADDDDEEDDEEDDDADEDEDDVDDDEDDEDDEDDDDDDFIEDGEIESGQIKGGQSVKKTKAVDSITPITKLNIPMDFAKNESDYESNSDEEENDTYLQKFDVEQRENYILDQHPESIIHNYNEVYNLSQVQRDKDNMIVDDLHKTIPVLTKYERTRILGQRAKQINNGAKPFVVLKSPIIDGYLIALKELEEKKIPVIIRRPLPNGASEYWKLKDLEIL